MTEEATVTVEFYGIPRQRAGRAALRVQAGNVAEVLARVQEQCPGLNLMSDEGLWPKEYLLSLNGERFVTTLDEQLKPGERVLLLSADAGG